MNDQALTFSELKKNLKKDFTTLPDFKIALLGDSPTQLLNQAIRGYAFSMGWEGRLLEWHALECNQPKL